MAKILKSKWKWTLMDW